MYQPIRTPRLYEQIVEQIAAHILSGELEPGDQLPSERRLADEFNVSRSAVREAMRSLHEKGLVEILPGKGTFVTDGTGQVIRKSLDLMLRIGQADGSDNLVEVREILEPEIAARAAERAPREQLECLRQSIRVMDEHLEDADLFIEADLEFHLALARSTLNPLIPLLIDPIVDLLREQRSRIFKVKGGPNRGQQHHKRILAAVEARDPQAARQAMQDHLQQVREDSHTAAHRSAGQSTED